MLFQLVVEPLVVSERWSCRDIFVGACATAHRSFKGRCRASEELDKFFRPLLACIDPFAVLLSIEAFLH
jgi:hypothetical protein